MDQDSVNCVLVDDAPEDRQPRLLVAGNVRLNPSAEVLILSSTTLMPNIRGLPSLAAMLFAPVMELR